MTSVSYKTTWMKLKGIILSKIGSHRRTNTADSTYVAFKVVKPIEANNRMLLGRDWG